MKKILIAAGGSGGHIFPALALGRSLKSRGGIDVMYVGSDRALDIRIFEREGAEFRTVSANRLSYRISWRSIAELYKLAIDIIKAFSIVRSFRPDVVVGFGGYVSFPVVFVSWIMRKPTIVHEQNARPGRANRLLFAFADRIALSFSDTAPADSRYERKCVLTGNPVRGEISACDRPCGAKRFGLSQERFTILVIGGSQGASFLNRTFIDAISGMDPSVRRSMQVIHITGVTDYESALRSYGRLGIDFRVHSFIDRIEEAYAAADLVITRSGASAVFELALLGKPMILVPYPYAMSHQLDNALAFGRQGAAIVVEEKSLTPAALEGLVLGLMNDGNRMRAIGDSARRLAMPEASNRLADAALAMIGR